MKFSAGDIVRVTKGSNPVTMLLTGWKGAVVACDKHSVTVIIGEGTPVDVAINDVVLVSAVDRLGDLLGE